LAIIFDDHAGFGCNHISRTSKIKAYYRHTTAECFQNHPAAAVVKAREKQEIVAVVKLEQVILR